MILLLTWQIEYSIDPDNSNLHQLELFFISLQSLSYQGSTVEPWSKIHEALLS